MLFKTKCKCVYDNTVILEINDDGVLEYFKKHIETPLKAETKILRDSRSLSQNAFYWKCVNILADALKVKADFVHVYMLKQVQSPVTIEIRQESIEALKDAWRTYEIVDTAEDDNGNPTFIVNCFFGSEYMDTKEFSHLIDVIIAEMKECNVELPSEELRDFINDFQH